MKLINEGNGYWGVEYRGARVITGESYVVASNIAEGNGTGETEEVRRSILGSGLDAPVSGNTLQTDSGQD
jgi:hypothetical protein